MAATEKLSQQFQSHAEPYDAMKDRALEQGQPVPGLLPPTKYSVKWWNKGEPD